MRGAGFDEVRTLVEEVLVGLMEHLKKRVGRELGSLRGDDTIATPKVPFNVFDREALVEKFGTEWEKRLPRHISEPAWVTNIPREFYDFEDPRTGTWDNYDLIVPKYGEVLSGARREWEFERIRDKMARDGVRQENYALLLKLAREGKLRPSAGAGLGVERTVAWITGTKHIGEVQPFPKVPGIVNDL